MSEDSLDREERWRSRACADVDPEVFFPIGTEGIERAVTLCRSCPLQQQCLSLALSYGETDGVWGATTRTARQQMNRGRRPVHRARQARDMEIGRAAARGTPIPALSSQYALNERTISRAIAFYRSHADTETTHAPGALHA